MAQQIINLGATGSGAGGDSARTAFEKAKTNFAELYIAALPGTAAQKQAARNMFGLGTAATRAVQTGPTDTTTGALMAVGAFGLGGINVIISNTDLNALTKTGFYMGSNLVNAPLASTAWFYVLHQEHGAAGFSSQIAIDLQSNTPKTYQRQKTVGTWSSWYELYHRGNILGTVSQSAGVPTGAIIERGSNANGQYVKFADGTQVCTFLFTGALSVSAVAGITGLNKAHIRWNFPATFYNTSTLSLSGCGIDNSQHGWVGGGSFSTSYADMQYFTPNGSVTATAIRFMAIGRWY